jgi:hypothetical protein
MLLPFVHVIIAKNTGGISKQDRWESSTVNKKFFYSVRSEKPPKSLVSGMNRYP